MTSYNLSKKNIQKVKKIKNKNKLFWNVSFDIVQNKVFGHFLVLRRLWIVLMCKTTPVVTLNLWRTDFMHHTEFAWLDAIAKKIKLVEKSVFPLPLMQCHLYVFKSGFLGPLYVFNGKYSFEKYLSLHQIFTLNLALSPSPPLCRFRGLCWGCFPWVLITDPLFGF